MIGLRRTDNTLIGRWWWTVDRWALAAVALLIAIGAVLTLAASPSVAARVGLPSFHFVQRQFLLLMPALGLMFAVSLLNPRGVRRLACLGFALSLAAMAATLALGTEIKGAQRWLDIGGLSVQPSEFVKPTFAVLLGQLLAEWRKGEGFPGAWLGGALCAVVVALLLAQPDVGMALLVLAVWFAELFLAGMPMALVGISLVAAVAGSIGAYIAFPHVANRIDRFLDPVGRDTYQIDRAMEAFAIGGLTGRGPGEGAVKNVLPDAHSDFIFAVAGEEFGLWLCLAIIGVFGFIVLKSLSRLLRENDLFVVFAAGGLIAQFGLQAVINIGVSLRLLPTKGMTLPFISYGGSSLLALALAMGMILSLTRARPGREAGP
jgi:cell division protein FtsW